MPRAVSIPSDEPARELVSRCAALGMGIGVAESLTGGLVCDALVRIPGASRVFLGGIIAYSDAVKREQLGVDGDLLGSVGAIDADVAHAMARGARNRFTAGLAMATTGVAGPDAQDGNPPGTVFIAVDTASRTPRIERLNLVGGREEIRQRAVTAVLQLALQQLRDMDV